MLELVIVLALIIIALTLGIPTLREIMIQARVNNQTYNLSRDILLARNHAIYHQTQVVICHLTESNNCDDQWSSGYSVFLDFNRDQVFQANQDRLLVVRTNPTDTDKLTFSGSDSLRYDADGHLNGLSGTFRYCPDVSDEENYARAVVVSLGGRPRVSDDIDGDGKDELNDESEHVHCSG